MSKKILSLFLALCMILTMLPILAMAEEGDSTIGTRGGIIAFASLDQLQTEKTVTVGTSIEDLELPETLPATVRTNPETVTDRVYGSEYEETLVDIPVIWTSQPEYDMDTEGEYLFTPVIEGYTVSAELPVITVAVGAAMLRGMVSPMAVTEYKVWVGGVQVTNVNKNGITGTGITGTVTYDSDTNTLTLNNAEITKARTSFFGDTFCIHSEVSTPLILNLIGENIITGVDSELSTYGIRCSGELTIEGKGSLTVTPGEAYITNKPGNNHSSGILTEGGLTINDVTLDVWGEQFGLYEYWGGNITINGGTVTVYGGEAAIMVDRDLKTNGKKVSVMVGDEKPGHEWDGSTNLFETYKYVKIELTTDVAQIGETGYPTLQGAVNAVTEGDTIQLLADITLTKTVTISKNHNITIDLNGKTLKNDCNHVINKSGSGTLTIIDSGSGGVMECTSTSPWNYNAIYNQGTGEVIIKGGTISSYNVSIVGGNGMLSIHGGTISSAASNAIQSDNTVNVYGGTVISAGSNGLSAITGNIVNVFDGLVENTNSGHAIFGNTVSISGGTIQNNAEHGITIGIGYKGISLTLTGGTIENSHSSGTAIYASSSSTITIPSGIVTIKGGGKAINAAPDLSGYTKVKILGSTTNADVTEAIEITKDDIDTSTEVEAYKYLEFGPATAPNEPTNLTATPSDGQLTLTWTAPTSTGGSPITAYKISTDDGASWEPTGSTNTSYIVTGLTNRTSYTLMVRAVNAIGDGAESAGITATPVAPTYTISGTIKGSDTNSGSGIADATVQLKKENSNIGRFVLTDSNGAYTISNVPIDIYSIEVSAGGYDSGIISSVVVSNAHVTGKDLTLTKTVTFIPVKDITMTNVNSVQVNTDLTLVGIVSPDTATNRTITWSVEDANGTGATISGSTFRATAAGTATVKATVINGLTASSDYTKTFTITVTEAPVVTYTITAMAGAGGSISPRGSVTVNNGASQAFTITPNSNYSITDVKVDNVSQGGITSYTFNDVTANHTISATFSYSGGSDSDSGSDRSSSVNSSSPVIVTSPTPDKPNSPTQGEIKVPGTVDSKGNVTVSITAITVTAAFDKALAEAKKKGHEQNGITVVLRVDTGRKAGSNVTVNLPKAVQDTIIEKKIVNTIVVVDNPDITIGMDLTTVKEINKQANSDVNVTATRGDSSKLTEKAKKTIGNRPVFHLQVNYGSDKQVQSFGAGSVSVTIPYTLGANEKADNVKAVYIDHKGKVHWLTDSVYDSVEKVLRFSTNHFSTYGVAYKEEAPAFTDMADHWAKEDIDFVVSHGLFSGTSATTFSPNTEMTRGMFVTVLGRLANADVSSYKESSFTDVKSEAYYMGYIEWASKNSIVNGTGNGTFAPDQSITREQMAVIMENYVKTIGFTLPKVHGENIFADSAKISAYTKDAVMQMQMAGVISGKNDNLVDPQGTTTRAEVSAVLHRFVELTDDVLMVPEK